MRIHNFTTHDIWLTFPYHMQFDITIQYQKVNHISWRVPRNKNGCKWEQTHPPARHQSGLPSRGKSRSHSRSSCVDTSLASWHSSFSFLPLSAPSRPGGGGRNSRQNPRLSHLRQASNWGPKYSCWLVSKYFNPKMQNNSGKYIQRILHKVSDTYFFLCNF